jgi:hypothetical protein
MDVSDVRFYIFKKKMKKEIKVAKWGTPKKKHNKNPKKQS